MDFKTFHKQQKNTAYQNADQQENLRKTAEAYRNKSDDELLNDIIKTVTQGKQDGSFSEEGLQQFIKNVSPMLNQEQIERLNHVIEIIRRS